MLQQLIDNYENFSDALIARFSYISNFDYYNLKWNETDLIELEISCFNKNRNYERDLIKISCKSIVYYNFHKIEGMIFQALLKNDNGIIVLDFFPDLESNLSGAGVISIEKLNSDCIIKCKAVEYEVVG